jgi:hypothetical protein
VGEELGGEGDELPGGLFAFGELAAAQHQDGGFHRLCDEVSAAFFELGVQCFAFGLETGGVRGSLGGSVPGDAAAFAFEGSLGGEVAVPLGQGEVLGFHQLAALCVGVGDPGADHEEDDGGVTDEVDAEAADSSGQVIEGYAVKQESEAYEDQRDR